MKIKTIFIYILFYFVIFGSLYLIYMQNIDGVYLNKPFTFAENIDPQNFKTDKEVYQRGDPLYIIMSACKNRNYTAEITWRLINATVITFPSTGSRIVSIGCIKDKAIFIGIIPQYAVLGTHHLEETAAIHLNGIHTIYYQFRSQNFLVQ